MNNKMLEDYEIVIASDISERSGIGIEVWKDDKHLLEVFRDDQNRIYTISWYVHDLPLELIEQSIERFKKDIPQSFPE